MRRLKVESFSTDVLKLANDEASRWLFFMDGETLLSQLDLIENCDKFRNLVILQSSVERIREKYLVLRQANEILREAEAHGRTQWREICIFVSGRIL